MNRVPLVKIRCLSETSFSSELRSCADERGQASFFVPVFEPVVLSSQGTYTNCFHQAEAKRTLNERLCCFCFVLFFYFNWHKCLARRRPLLVWHQGSICLQKQNASTYNNNKDPVPRIGSLAAGISPTEFLLL